MRDALITSLTTALSNSAVKVSKELPWGDSKEPLYVKNMKTLYIDRGETTQSVVVPVLAPYNDVMETVTTIKGYFTVDAKSQPSGLDAVITTLETAKNAITIVRDSGREFSYNTDIQGDVLLYTIEYRFVSIT